MPSDAASVLETLEAARRHWMHRFEMKGKYDPFIEGVTEGLRLAITIHKGVVGIAAFEKETTDAE